MKIHTLALLGSKKNNVLPIDVPIIFIVAKGRSGTTLLQTMLDAHPNTIAPFESKFVIHFYHKYGKVTNWTTKIKQSFIKDVITEQMIHLFWDLNQVDLTNRIMSLPPSSTYGTVCKQVYGSFISLFKKGQPLVIIDKNPIHGLLIPLVQEIYPEAKFIHLIRDYRACANSVLKFRKSISSSTLGFRWLLSNQAIEKAIPTPHLIRYEDLLTNPKQELSQLCPFIGIDFSEHMIQFHTSLDKALKNYVDQAKSEEIRQLRTEGLGKIHANIARPINPTFIDKWKSQLTPQSIKELDKICSFYGSKYGYHGITKEFPEKSIPIRIRFFKFKMSLYYRLPIWLRELKSKPKIVYLEN